MSMSKTSKKVDDFIFYAGDGQTEQVEKLIASGVGVDSQDKEGATALMHGVLEGFFDVVELLLSHKADVNIKDQHGKTAMIWAAESATMNDESFPKIVDLLASHGADINTKNSDGLTALMIAARDGQLEFVRRLLQNGANVNEGDAGGANWTAIDYAESFRHPEVVELLKKGR